MNIAEIITERDDGVVTIFPSETVENASSLMTEHSIGALVVCDRWGKVIGIITERDIVRAIGNRGSGATKLPVSAIMSQNVVTCTPLDATDDVMAQMNRRRFRHMPVVDQKELVGMISVRDLLKSVMDAKVQFEAWPRYLNRLQGKMPAMITR